MMERVEAGGLKIERVLHDFIEQEALPGTGIAAHAFWSGFGETVRDLAPKNRALLDDRDAIQAKIDAWHAARAGQPDATGPNFVAITQSSRRPIAPDAIAPPMSDSERWSP